MKENFSVKEKKIFFNLKKTVGGVGIGVIIKSIQEV